MDVDFFDENYGEELNALDTEVMNITEVECIGWVAAEALIRHALKEGATCIVEKQNDEVFKLEVLG